MGYCVGSAEFDRSRPCPFPVVYPAMIKRFVRERCPPMDRCQYIWSKRDSSLALQKNKQLSPLVVSKSAPSKAKQLRSISKLRFLHNHKALKIKKTLVIKRKATT